MSGSSTQKNIKFQRILLKLSGESLTGSKKFGIDPQILNKVALEIGQLVGIGVEVGVVVGGGNLFRGEELNSVGLGRVSGDHMGMLATVMNSIAVKDALARINVEAQIMSAIPIGGMVDHYNHRNAMNYLQKKNVVLFAAGTGNPFFTTDTAACLRGIEIEANLILKATKVDGVYDKDPMLHKDAVKFDTLSFDEVIEKKLAVMDFTAICLCREHNIPLRVFNVFERGALADIIVGEAIGTLINC